MRNAMIVLSALVIGTVTIGAQSSSTEQSQKPVSFVGCLEQSRRATTAESDAFVLNTPTPAASTVETAQRAATSGQAAIPPLDAGDTGRAESKIANVFVLDGAQSDLSKHVGHKVEVTGLLKPATTPAASETAVASGKAPAPAVPHLQVSAVKMVAASCSTN